MRCGFTPRSLKSASCRRKTRFSASIDRRHLAVSTSKPIKSPSRRRTKQAKAITPTSCHGFHARTQPQSRGSSFCGRQGVVKDVHGQTEAPYTFGAPARYGRSTRVAARGLGPPVDWAGTFEVRAIVTGNRARSMIRVFNEVVSGASTTTRRNVVLASPTSPQARSSEIVSSWRIFITACRLACGASVLPRRRPSAPRHPSVLRPEASSASRSRPRARWRSGNAVMRRRFRSETPRVFGTAPTELPSQPAPAPCVATRALDVEGEEIARTDDACGADCANATARLNRVAGRAAG
jgi:hypothetical protein